MSGIYQFSPEDAERFAKDQGIRVRKRGNELMFFRCPYCRNNTDDKNTFAINLETGQFKCLRASCGAHGNMITLSRDFDFSLGTEVDEYYRSQKRFRNIHRKGTIEIKPEAVAYLESRGISQAVTERYQITTQKEHDNILVFPFFDENNILQFVKYRKTDFDKAKDKSKEWCEANCKPILFGMNQCDPANGTLVLTEGQIDSLSVAEAGISNAVSVPTGAKGFTWVPYCWNFLSKFDTLIVFGDHEHDTITLLDEMRNRFHGKVKHVQPEDYRDCKDANELLQKYGKQAVIDAVQKAIPVQNPKIKRMSDIKRVDLSKMEHIKTSIGQLDSAVGGFFFGQLILLTGERGDGKSTLASQFGVWGLRAGYGVFYYSGELPDHLLRDWFDRQVAGKMHINKLINSNGFENYSVDGNSFDAMTKWYRDKVYVYDNGILFDADPGATEEEALIKTLESAITQYGCKVLIVDNLMTAMEDDLSSDIYRQQTVFVKQLAFMAKRFDAIIVLIAHPKKQDIKNFTNDDVAGSSNITNLCDVVLRYTRPRDLPDTEETDSKPDRLLQIYKNRLTGKLNTKGIPLFYEDASKRIAETKMMFDWNVGWEDRAGAARLPDTSEFIPIEENDIDGIFTF